MPPLRIFPLPPITLALTHRISGTHARTHTRTHTDALTRALAVTQNRSSIIHETTLIAVPSGGSIHGTARTHIHERTHALHTFALNILYYSRTRRGVRRPYTLTGAAGRDGPCRLFCLLYLHRHPTYAHTHIDSHTFLCLPVVGSVVCLLVIEVAVDLFLSLLSAFALDPSLSAPTHLPPPHRLLFSYSPQGLFAY